MTNPNPLVVDGFYVAKFKVGKRSKKLATTTDDEPVMMLDDEGMLVEQERTTFNEDEDEALIRGEFGIADHELAMCCGHETRTKYDFHLSPTEAKRQALKAKGVKLSKPTTTSTATPASAPKPTKTKSKPAAVDLRAIQAKERKTKDNVVPKAVGSEDVVVQSKKGKGKKSRTAV